MTCDTADAYLHRSLDESLTQSERVALDDHWDECAACRRERIRSGGWRILLISGPLRLWRHLTPVKLLR